MSDEEHTAPYAVWWWDPDDYSECVGEGLDAGTAVRLAKQLTESVGGRIGTIRRIIITDCADYTCFEWIHGKGVTFPEVGTNP